MPLHRQNRKVKRYVSLVAPLYIWEVVLFPLMVGVFLLVWSFIVRFGNYQAFILPSPQRVWERFLQAWYDGILAPHILVTLKEIGGGLALGLSVALVFGYLLAKSHFIERLLSPYIVASQAIPIVALAPLLVIWFGSGSLSKILVTALTLFFPVLVNTIVGIRTVERDLIDLMRSLHANRWTTFRLLEVPAALPVLFGGLKVGVTLSVIGAVVGEFVGSDRGLGFLVNLAKGLFDTPLMFVALFILMILALILYGAVALLERWFLRWRY